MIDVAEREGIHVDCQVLSANLHSAVKPI
jgi:Fe2+ transport system protein B